jgi:hypothetical protein
VLRDVPLLNNDAVGSGLFISAPILMLRVFCESRALLLLLGTTAVFCGASYAASDPQGFSAPHVVASFLRSAASAIYPRFGDNADGVSSASYGFISFCTFAWGVAFLAAAGPMEVRASQCAWVESSLRTLWSVFVEQLAAIRRGFCVRGNGCQRSGMPAAADALHAENDDVCLESRHALSCSVPPHRPSTDSWLCCLSVLQAGLSTICGGVSSIHPAGSMRCGVGLALQVYGSGGPSACSCP